MKSLEHLTPEIARCRYIGTAEAAALCNLSVNHLRRLYGAGKFPTPVRLGTVKLGWKLGTVLDWLDAKQGEAGPMPGDGGTSLMNFVLPSGKRLADATEEEVLEAVKQFEAQAGALEERSRGLQRAAKIGRGARA